MSGEYRGWGRTSHFNVSKYVLQPILQHRVEHCHAGKSLYRVFHCLSFNAAVYLSILGLNTLIAFDTDRL